MKTKAVGFTLAEILITLGIIGIVAAMTLPNLYLSYKAHSLKSKFSKCYSTISQVGKLMQNDDVYISGKLYDLRNIFREYLQGTSVNVYSYSLPFWHPSTAGKRAHRSLDGTLVGSSFFDDGQMVLNDGTNLFFELGTIVTADINGYTTPPNKLGYDLFTFQYMLETGEIIPMGSKGTKYSDLNKYCNINIKSNLNGVGCAAKAINDSEYFKWAVKNIK